MRITRKTHPEYWKWAHGMSALEQAVGFRVDGAAYRQYRQEAEQACHNESAAVKDAWAAHVARTHPGFHDKPVSIERRSKNRRVDHAHTVLHIVVVVLLLILLGLLAARGAHAAPAVNLVGRGSAGASLHLYLEPGGLFPQLITPKSPFSFDASNNLKVNCITGCSAASGFTDNSVFTVGGSTVNVVGAYYTSGAAPAITSGNAGRLRMDVSSFLMVNCQVGCSGSSFADNSVFTAGTTPITNDGGVFNDGLAAVTSGNSAAFRITANRGLHVNLRNASGTEIGTSGAPVRTDPTGTTTQPVSGTVTDNQGTAAALSGAWPVKVTDGTNSMPTMDAIGRKGFQAVTDGSSTLQIDPCQAQGRSVYSVNITANTQIIAGTASKQTYICSALLIVGAATNVALVEGTGTVCATGIAGMSGGTTAATGWNLAANGGFTLGNGQNWVFKTATAADSVCLLVSAANQVSGTVTWTQF